MSITLPARRTERGRSGRDVAKELLRETYLAGDAFDARRRLVAFYNHCASSDLPDLTWLAKTIRLREVPILRGTAPD